MMNELADVLRASAQESEAADRLTPDSIEALRGAGAFALRSKNTWASPVVIAERLAEIGRSSASAAWVAGTCATTKTLFARNFGDAAPEEALADPDALACGSGVPAGTATRIGDEMRISGRWANISGGEDADWASLALLVDGVYSWAFIPLDRLKIEPTWQMAGMRATGSHTVVADEILVPARWVIAGRMPAPADQLVSGLTVLAPVVGATFGALELIRDMFASDRKPFMTNYERMSDSDGARHWFAEADRLARRAERTMLAVAVAAEDGELDQVGVAGAFSDLADAARDSRAAIEFMMDLHGASGFKTANALQRFWRDIAVGSRHPLLNPYLALERLGTATTVGGHV